MGKKTMSKTCSQSHKISKNHDKLKKQQLNSLIDFLKPKVYITDSSNFKSLVQELTGKGTHPDSSPLPAIPQPFEASVMPAVIHDVEGDQTYLENGIEEFSVESSDGSGQMSSFGSAKESSVVPCIQEPFTGLDNFAQFKDFESWLLETDLDRYDDAYAPMIQHDLQDVSVFDSYDMPCLFLDDNYQIQY
nr:hypothetical protein JCGZ_12000 [Ipomoea trifida]GMC70332.1 VQ motif-containing protein [Ipomoea batatas]GME13054.1 VQ motif-containing protein [Ipomoea batatas]